MSYKRTSLRNQKAKLAADYNELLKELSSHEMTSVGCYTIGDTIGEGTFGKVKLGTHKLTGHQVAVKKISKQHAPMIAREIHHHRQLEHPNIVRIYEIIVTETAIHIFSEYCPNGELFDLLASTGRFSEYRVQRWFQQLTSALQLCHRQGIVHRDLKLENILLDINDNCKICDFGFARFTDNKQLLETFCGSLAYSAPEVIMRQKYTGPETDIWSLGVILYTLLAGELPFDDDSEITTQRKIVNVDYEMPCYFSPYAQDLITNLLKREPADRLTMDQIINHTWMQNIFTSDNDDHSITSQVEDLDCPHSASRDDIDDDYDDDDSSSSTRYSSRSDLDSIFSNSRFKNDLMEGDEDDLVTEASFVSNSDLSGKSGDFMQQHNLRKGGFNNYSDGSKFSPQVRSSLGMMRPEDKAKYTSRSPRFSAPTVSNRHSSSTALSASPFRSSLPLSLPSNRESIRPSSIPSASSLDTPMNYTEQRLATALVTAGFDDYFVQSMRSNTCGTSNTLWNMLMEKQQQRQQHSDLSSSMLINHSQKSIDLSDKWPGSSTSTIVSAPRHFSPRPSPTSSPVDSASQTNMPMPPPPAMRVDSMTQTTPLDIQSTVSGANNVLSMDTNRMETTTQPPLLPPKPPPSTININQPCTVSGNTAQNKSPYRSVSRVPSASSISVASSEKSGWFSSVKSWFGGNAGKYEPGFYEAPLRSSSVRQHNHNHGQPVSYRDFDFCQNGSAQQQDEVTPGIYRSGPIPKYQRQMLRSIDWDQQHKNDNTRNGIHRTHQLNTDHLSTTMNGMLSPPPPTATLTTANSLSIITTPSKPDYRSTTIPPTLSPPAPPAAIYTNNSKNSNNRLCYQNQCLPRQLQQQQPSPPPTPPDVEPTSILPELSSFSNNVYTPSTTSSKSIRPTKPSSPSPLSITLEMVPSSQPNSLASSPNLTMEKSTTATTIPFLPPCPPLPPSSSSPLPNSMSSARKDSESILPPTPPTTDEDAKKEWTSTASNIDDQTLNIIGIPSPTSTSASLSHLKPYSSKSSPALLSSSPKNSSISSASRRFEFGLRSRLSVYGMNDRASSMASKAIIEEEEEEE